MSMSNKKKQGQKYKNKTKFKINDDSKLTQRIKATPLDHLCQRCYDQIKWKMDYKKYKPLSQPGKCNDCKARCVLKAYRALCDKCALKKVEFRVPRAQAIEMGIIDDGKEEEEEDLSGKVPEESEELANQVIVEEDNDEDEESKEEAASGKIDTPKSEDGEKSKEADSDAEGKEADGSDKEGSDAEREEVDRKDEDQDDDEDDMEE